ncbi:uncharacterized protein LOC143857311 isoform X2 [Tasmannia lanceolata]|uniref:uncharacterized protein LOC143857311 isoform X2 n=1 Tax=Tasmannia lanceolata TaxID=3420 RepID=UPI004063C0DC
MKIDDLPVKLPFYPSLLGKGRYKLWALAAILLLSFWSMLTGSVTLKWFAGTLNQLTADLNSPIHDDLDVLEIEEREKVVKHMWDVYLQSGRIRLQRFWQEAFEAAYEELESDLPEVRDAAISEIAKMSIRMIGLEPFPRQSTGWDYDFTPSLSPTAREELQRSKFQEKGRQDEDRVPGRESMTGKVTQPTCFLHYASNSHIDLYVTLKQCIII